MPAQWSILPKLPTAVMQLASAISKRMWRVQASSVGASSGRRRSCRSSFDSQFSSCFGPKIFSSIAGLMLVDVPTSGAIVIIRSASGFQTRLVGGQLLAGLLLLAGLAQLVVDADAHQLRRQLTPHPLRVRGRCELEVDVERLWQAALFVDLLGDAIAVGLGLRFESLDAEPQVEPALLRVFACLAVLVQAAERIVERESVLGEDCGHLLSSGRAEWLPLAATHSSPRPLIVCMTIRVGRDVSSLDFSNASTIASWSWPPVSK